MKIIICIIGLLLIVFIIWTFIINFVIDEHIPKQSIINDFNENAGAFNKICEYANSTEGNISISIINGAIQIKNSTADDTNDVKIDNLQISNEIMQIIQKLEFTNISESNDYILFMREGPSYEQGILYNKTGTRLNYFDEEIPITGNWYYYLKTYT
jgi:hypothetical protein